jgi:hypothetical protein
VLNARTRSLRRRLPLFGAAVALVLVMAAPFSAVTIQPAAAYPSDLSGAALTPASRGASCTAAQKAKRQAKSRAYQRRMRARQRAYFRAHASVKLRRVFVRRQRTRLKSLQAAASCTVPEPPPAPPPPPLVPPVPGPYGGVTSQSASVDLTVSADGSAVMTFAISRNDQICMPQGSLANTTVSMSQLPYSLSPINRINGSFSVTGGGHGVRDGVDYRNSIVLDGRVEGSSAEGEILVTTRFTAQGTDYTCSAGTLTWSVTHTG